MVSSFCSLNVCLFCVFFSVPVAASLFFALGPKCVAVVPIKNTSVERRARCLPVWAKQRNAPRTVPESTTWTNNNAIFVEKIVACLLCSECSNCHLAPNQVAQWRRVPPLEKGLNRAPFQLPEAEPGSTWLIGSTVFGDRFWFY